MAGVALTQNKALVLMLTKQRLHHLYDLESDRRDFGLVADPNERESKMPTRVRRHYCAITRHRRPDRPALDTSRVQGARNPTRRCPPPGRRTIRLWQEPNGRLAIAVICRLVE